MAPVTRTRSKALDKATSEEHGRATSISTSITTIEPTTRKRLAMRTRDGDGDRDGDETGGEDNATVLRRVQIETQLLSGKSKRPRSSSVADSVADSGDAALEPQSASKQLEEEAGQRLPDPEPSPQKDKKEGKSKHVVFGDDDDIDKYVAAAKETSNREPEAAAQEEEAEDSDDVPEAVSTKVAAKETLESAKALANATEKQATMLKRKRQERDILFKQQAKKRKSASNQPETEGEPVTTGRRRTEKLKLPSVLPAEFLADSSSESEDEDDEAALRSRVVNRPKKTNFEDRTPRDQVIGSTVYRVVTKQVDRKLAPKMHKDTCNVKEDMLRRKRAAVAPNKREGFFIRK